VPEYSSILIVQTAFPGDVILTLPLLQALKRAFPQAGIDMLVIPNAGDLLAQHPAVRETLLYDKRGKDRGLRGLFAQIRRIRSRHYDLAIVPHRSMRSALLVSLGNIPQRVGFDTSALSLLFTTRIRYDKSLHEVDRNLSLLSGIGLPIQPRELPKLYPSASDISNVDEILQHSGLAGKRTIIAVAPGSVWDTKRWPADRFTALCQALAKDGHTVLLIGREEDARLCSEIAANSPGILSLAGRTSLLQSAEMIRRCRLLVSNDSAPMHLAVAMGTPVVAIFGPTVPRFGFTPLGEHDVVVETEGLPCRPCSIHGGPRCPIGTFECMLAITVGRVRGQVDSLLTQQGR
jgi:heptosyltransferase-2